MRFRLCTTKQCAESKLPTRFYTRDNMPYAKEGTYAMIVRSTPRARRWLHKRRSRCSSIARVAVACDATGLTRLTPLLHSGRRLTQRRESRFRHYLDDKAKNVG